MSISKLNLLMPENLVRLRYKGRRDVPESLKKLYKRAVIDDGGGGEPGYDEDGSPSLGHGPTLNIRYQLANGLLWQDEAKTIPAGDGDPVCVAVCPHTGLEYVSYNGEIDCRPILYGNPEYHAWLNFDGNDFLKCDFALNAGCTFSLGLTLGAYDSGIRIIQSLPDGPNLDYIHMYNDGNTIEKYIMWRGSAYETTDFTPGSSAHTVTATYSAGGTGRFYSSSQDWGSGPVGTNAGTEIWVGGNEFGAQFQGTLFAFYPYTRVLSDDERNNLDSMISSLLYHPA